MHSLIYIYTHFTAESEPGTTFEKLATFLSWILVLVLFPFSLYCCYVKVNEFNRVLIFRLGRVRYYKVFLLIGSFIFSLCFSLSIDHVHEDLA